MGGKKMGENEGVGQRELGVREKSSQGRKGKRKKEKEKKMGWWSMVLGMGVVWEEREEVGGVGGECKKGEDREMKINK